MQWNLFTVWWLLGVALTHISAHNTHKNLAVRKTLSDAYSVCKKRDEVSTRLKLHMRQMITEGTRVLWKESAHRLRTTFQYFAESFDGGEGACEKRHSFLCFVGTHFRIFVRKNPHPLREVCASPQKLARPLVHTLNLFLYLLCNVCGNFSNDHTFIPKHKKYAHTFIPNHKKYARATFSGDACTVRKLKIIRNAYTVRTKKIWETEWRTPYASLSQLCVHLDLFA